MAHKLADIMAGIQARLAAGGTDAAGRVYLMRPLALPARQTYPVICIFPVKEKLSRDEVSGVEYDRANQLAVACLVSGGSPETDLLALQDQVEAIVEADPTHGGRADDSELAEIDYADTDLGNKPITLARLLYHIHYTYPEESR